MRLKKANLIIAFAAMIVMPAYTVLAQEPAPLHDAKFIAGPHLTGDEYLSLRETNKMPAVSFVLRHETEAGTSQRRIDIAPDLAIDEGPVTTSIYDFKFRRLLKLPVQGNTFTNDSLYGLFLTRWEYLQNNLRASAASAAQADDEAALLRFWNEQNNGLTIPPGAAEDAIGQKLPRPQIQVSPTAHATRFLINEEPVVFVRWSETRFPTPQHAEIFTAWSIWALRIHPRIAEKMEEDGRLPLNIEVKSDPELSGEIKTGTYEFSEIANSEASLDDIAGRLNGELDWRPWLSPDLVGKMVSAARATPPAENTDTDGIATEIEVHETEGDILSAVLVAAQASLSRNGCDGSVERTGLCEKIIRTIEKARTNATVTSYFEALRLDQMGKHADAAHALIALRAAGVARTDLLDLTIAQALVGAKRARQLDETLTTEFENLTELYERIFAVDPFDPSHYRDVRDYVHAAVAGTSNGFLAHIYAYPIIDLARSLPVERQSSNIDKASQTEEQIERDFPMLFPSRPIELVQPDDENRIEIEIVEEEANPAAASDL